MVPGESEVAAVTREVQEELGVLARAASRLWTSTTSWNVSLSWWLAEIDTAAVLAPNPAEVSETHWLTPREIRNLPELLESNLQFLDAWERGDFELIL